MLTFMVGGPESSFQAASEYLSLMGKNVVHCGAVGTGQVIYLNINRWFVFKCLILSCD